MQFNTLFEKIKSQSNHDAVIFKGQTYSYQNIFDNVNSWHEFLVENHIKPNNVIALRSDYSFPSLTLFLSLLLNKNIVALLPDAPNHEEQLKDAQAQGVFYFGDDENYTFEHISFEVTHPFLTKLQNEDHAGFIIFSSGSTGKPKAILHDIENFAIKFEKAEKKFRTLSFLLFDHIAGLDTLFYTLFSGGTLIFPEGRDVSSVCRIIEAHNVEVLPTSPSFLNLLCLSGEYQTHDLSSLKIITYGSEPMNNHTLVRLNEIFKNAKIIQKYGTSEFGSPMSRSQGNDNLWIKIDSDLVHVKIIDCILWVKSKTAMIGYLNAPNPFDDEGWICTGDEVNVDGEWIRILGRKSDLIIVGGEKVYPAEIENVIIELESVIDVAVRGESHPLMGQIVCAKVYVESLINKKELEKEIRKFCRLNLEAYKVPVKIEFTDETVTNSRHKKIRR